MIIADPRARLTVNRLAHLIAKSVRNAQRLFHMLTGLAFLILAALGASVSLKEWLFYRQAPSMGLLRCGLLAAFTVLLVILCLYSFAKARSVR